MTRLPPHDEDAERAVLGCVFLSDNVLDPALDMGLRPEHFYRERHRQMWGAAIELRMRGRPVDPITVSSSMSETVSGLSAYAHSLPGQVPSIGHWREYVGTVLAKAEWRSRLLAAQQMQVAVYEENQEGWAAAQRLLENPAQRSREVLTPEAWAEVLLGYFDREKVKSIPMPFVEMTTALDGGLRGGELMLVAGYTSHGKSVFVDQLLDMAADQGYRCHLYMTEMTAIERGLRLLARMSGVPFNALRRRALDQSERNKIAASLTRLPYGVSIVADWNIDDVYRDVMRSKWDLIVIDLIHGFTYKDERELDYLSKMSMRMAKASTTDGEEGTAVVTVGHLNESQMQGTSKSARPRPSLRSIKGGSSLKQDADFVTFVWREDDKDGVPKSDGEVWVAKGRNTGLAHVDVRFVPQKMRFEPIYNVAP